MIDRIVYSVGTLAILLRTVLSQECPSGCTCSLNGSNDGTIVVCNGSLDEFLVFHLVRPKIVSVVIRNYQNLESVDLSEHSLADLSDVQIGRGSIKHLDLSYNQITTASLQHFASLDMLELINLSNNGMTSFDTSNVSGMRNLIEINLEDNELRNLILNPTFYTIVNFPYLTITLYRNPLECLCDLDNALTKFAPGKTSCLTADGQTSTLQEDCSNMEVSSSMNVSSTGNLISTFVGNSSSGLPLENITTLQPAAAPTTTSNVHSSSPTFTRSLSSTRIIPTFPTPSMSPLDVTGSQQENRNNDEQIFVIIGGTITGVMAILIVLLFILMILVCRLKKRFVPSGQTHNAKVTTVRAEPENYLSPIRMASIRGIEHITETAVRMSQIPDPHYEEIDPVSERLGPVPPLPDIVETSITGAPTIVPYHVTTIEDIDGSTGPNQYLDLQA